MTQLIDFSTNVAKVRLLIADLDDTEKVFNDFAIEAFIDMALDSNLKRAAAQALMSIAVNEVLVQKRIKILDLSTDGPAEAIQLRIMAKLLFQQADDEELTGAFDWAEQINNTWQYNELLYKDAIRS